jgi:hypothetical protein
MDFIYDIETFPNAFTVAVEHADLPAQWSFEISDWCNDSDALREFLHWLRANKHRMVGFNNLGFDYPVLHAFMRMGKANAAALYDKAQAIIQGQDGDDRWKHTVKPSDRMVEQIDLFKIHHFDNKARSTGLKALEFNMRADSIADLPFPVGTILDRQDIQKLKLYNQHDVAQTKRFYQHTLPMIRFREELSAKLKRDFMNHNDTKIGKDYFAMELESAGVQCYKVGPDGREPLQTLRPVIHLKDAILPWINFDHSEFKRVHTWLLGQSITETKGVFKDLRASINGFEFVFGLGGIHGSVESKVVDIDEDWDIIDLDVTSYYPTLAIQCGFHPAHLTDRFCSIYGELFEQRKSYPKGSAENAMLKLALNGVYGDSNNKFSIFYDPLFTMQITLNGQLLLCMLAEKLLEIDKLEMIQANTDGLTIKVLRRYQNKVNECVEEWQCDTGLQMEQKTYRSMMIRDVNNYIGQYEDGSLKRKGAYEYNMAWHQDASALVVAKVAEKVLVEGAPIRETIERWPDIMDFMCRIKVPRNSYLSVESNGQYKTIQNTSRYYVAEGGDSLVKWMPPLKGKTEWRKIGVQSGWGVQVCNDIKDISLPVDFDFYVKEVEKLCLILA